MNVEIGAEAALFPEKEYISGIFVAVHLRVCKLEPIEDLVVMKYGGHWRKEERTPGLSSICIISR